MMQRYFFIFGLICAASIRVDFFFAQTTQQKYKAFEKEKDPTIKAYLATVLALKYIQENDDSVRFFKTYAKKHMKIGTLSEAGVLQIEIQEHISSGDASEFMMQAIRARNIYKKNKIQNEVDAMGIAIGYIANQNGDFPKSSAEYMAVYESLKPKMYQRDKANESDKSNYSSLLSHLSYMYYSIGEFENAIQYNLETALFLKETKDYPNYAFAISNSGATYVKMKQYNKAINCYLESLKIRDICLLKIIQKR
jgi:tetratricopeptide (TPR) repeat protein